MFEIYVLTVLLIILDWYTISFIIHEWKTDDELFDKIFSTIIFSTIVLSLTYGLIKYGIHTAKELACIT